MQGKSLGPILLWSTVPAALVLIAGFAYLLNVFGIYRHNLLVYCALLGLVALVYGVSVGVGLTLLAFRR